MPTRNVVLTSHQNQLVEQLVSSGRYQNASEVLREGLRMIEWREKQRLIKLAELQNATQQGIDDLNNDRFITFDTTKDLTSHLDTLTHQTLDIFE